MTLLQLYIATNKAVRAYSQDVTILNEEGRPVEVEFDPCPYGLNIRLISLAPTQAERNAQSLQRARSERLKTEAQAPQDSEARKPAAKRQSGSKKPSLQYIKMGSPSGKREPSKNAPTANAKCTICKKQLKDCNCPVG